MKIRLWIAIAWSVCLFSPQGWAVDWKPVPGHIMTEWAARVDPLKPLPEYPRPQMTRQAWVNLNGLWDYVILSQAGAAEAESAPASWAGKILVPFPVESALSGVKKPLQATECLWYRRELPVPTLTDGSRLLLHFGAVDWEARVFINGKRIGVHRGGYDGFSFDVTEAVLPGAANELTVAVLDNTTGIQPRGKQQLSAIYKPGGIWYTPCSGIWQTVWLETVPAEHLVALRIVPDLDNDTVRIEATANVPNPSSKMEVTVLEGEKTVATGSGKVGEPIEISIPDAQSWSPSDPFLYDLKIRFGNDEVGSYFGLRKIALAKDERGILRPMLNNRFVFQTGPLDQGYWPDGIYTAPTDEALRYDLEITKKLGFNMTRKHAKVEPARWYYWCDKLGLLVWQDMPSGRTGTGAGKDCQTGALRDGQRVSDSANAQFEAELTAMVRGLWNHPSVIKWVVFNEGWGQYETPRLVNMVKALDPTRLVSNASGWNDIKSGDVIDMHNYSKQAGSPKPEPDRTAVLGEFGGLALPLPEHMWVEKTWGYQRMSDAAKLTEKYVALWRKVWTYQDDPGLSAAVYTQLTDVETEANGLLTYDRKVIKVDMEKAAEAARGKR